MSTLSAEARALAGAAGDYINEHGWCQGNSELPTGQVCLIGGLESAARYAMSSAVVDALYTHLRRELTDGKSVADWNDDPARSQGEVVGVLFAVEEGWL